MIAVRHLSKQYLVHPREPGVLAALRSLVHRETRVVTAVEDVSFEIAAGERVGLLGANGAGKTTTLKTLAGLLHPTSGDVRVAGHDPRQRERAFLEQVSLVLGQRQRLVWDLPPRETFELHRVVYDLPAEQFRVTVGELSELLELGALPDRPTRELSLGERMKCELAAALLHRPKVLFLDEPTLGLDVTMQVAVRSFVKRYNEQYGATLVLTSHYLDDVVALCPRVIVLGQGRLVYDGSLEELARRVRPEKQLVLHLAQPVGAEELASLGKVIEHTPLKAVVRVAPAQLRSAMAEVWAKLPLRDLAVEDPPLEEVMAEVFAQPGAVRKGAP